MNFGTGLPLHRGRQNLYICKCMSVKLTFEELNGIIDTKHVDVMAE